MRPKTLPAGVRARRWARKNLFSTPLSSGVTVALGLATLWAGARFVRWLFVTAEWEAVQRNLTLFMMGTFPRDEQWRLVTSVILIGLAVGLAAGLLSGAARERAATAEEPFEPTGAVDLLRRYWALVAFVVVLLLAARTATPWLFTAGALVAGLAGHRTFARLGRRIRAAGWLAVTAVGIAAYQVLAGTGGNAWFFAALVAVVPAWALAGRVGEGRSRSAGMLLRLVGIVLAAAVVRGVYSLDIMDFGSVPIRQWAGLHLTLFVTVVTIVAAFPLGLALAMGRRSSLPVLRWLSTTYIELLRGVPLVTLLFVAQYFIGFFVAAASGLDLLTRAIIAMTLFTAAYVAEIVRGGLQAVPRGQVEAGQAVGLPAGKVMALIVLPQALRAAIPALVGQFISLFKDTSLLAAIGIIEFLGVREIVHSQPDFRIGVAEITLVFVAFGYWAIAYTMSRESQRLERSLGVGAR